MPVVKLYGNLRQLAGSAEIEVEGLTVRAVLERLCASQAELCEALQEGDHLRPYVRLMVNGYAVEFLEGAATPLGPEDQLAIFPPIAGG